jgi:hypothetical protein
MFDTNPEKIIFWLVIGSKVLPYTAEAAERREKRLRADFYAPMIVNIDQVGIEAPEGKICALCGHSASVCDCIGYWCDECASIPPVERAVMVENEDYTKATQDQARERERSAEEHDQRPNIEIMML